jgi:hypothetical protein
MDVNSIVKVLNKHHQRATYGAIAGLLGKSAQSLMKPYPQQRLYSWVVNKRTKQPTGYPPHMKHPHLEECKTVLDTTEKLRKWLNKHDHVKLALCRLSVA